MELSLFSMNLETYLSDNAGLAKLLSRIAVQGRKERFGSIFACHHLDKGNLRRFN